MQLSFLNIVSRIFYPLCFRPTFLVLADFSGVGLWALASIIRPKSPVFKSLRLYFILSRWFTNPSKCSSCLDDCLLAQHTHPSSLNFTVLECS